jgi:acyl carrier protein
MNADDLEQRLRGVIEEMARTDLTGAGLDEDLVRRLGLDSLAALRVLAAVEKGFDRRFPDDRLTEFRTLRQLRDFIAAGNKERAS